MRLLENSKTRSIFNTIKESLEYDVNEPNSMETVRYHRDNNVGGSILYNTYSDNYPSDPLTKEDLGKRVYDLRLSDVPSFEAYEVVEDDEYDDGLGYRAIPEYDIPVENFDYDMSDDEVDSWAKEVLGFNKMNESVTVTTGSTTITSDEMGVTVEDNGNVITTGNGATVNVTNSGDMLPTEMDLASPMDVPMEEPTMDEPIDEVPEELVDEVPEEDIENVEPTEDEEELEESTVNEEVLEKKDKDSEEERNNTRADKTVIKLSDTYREIDVPKGHIVATPSIAREMNKKQDKKIEEADGYNQNQNVEINQNPEFDYQILDITELDNVDSGDIRAIDMANILNNLDESLTERFGTANWGELNSFLTRKGTHKKTNESYSSAILELILPRLNESVGEYKNVYMLEVYGDKLIKECIVRDSKSHIIKEYSGKSKNPTKHFEGVILDIMNHRNLKEQISEEAYEVADHIAMSFEGRDLVEWDELQDAIFKIAEDLGYNLNEEEYMDFETDVRGCLGQLGWATIYEGEHEGGITTREDMFEGVEVMVNEPMKDKGVNFADSKAIKKDEDRQASHLKQHAKRHKEVKKFKLELEPDQKNTAGEKQEDISDTTKIPTLPKAKKTKVNAETIKKPKKLKESLEGSSAFWEAGIQPGDVVETSGAGNVTIIDLDRAADYILVNRGAGFQPFVAAWAPELYGGKLSWGQGHYFDNEEDARQYLDSKRLKESVIKEREEINPDYRPNTNFKHIDDVWEALDACNSKEEIKAIIDTIPEKFGSFVIEDNGDHITVVNNYSEYDDMQEDRQDFYFESVIKEADELLDDPDVTNGTDIETGELDEASSDVAIFHRKPASVDAMRASEQNGITVNKSNYRIIGKKELSAEEFNKFANNLTSEYEWLGEFNDTTNSGEFKCVEVINTEDNSFTLLVDPQGYKYARYAAIKENLEAEELLDEPTEEELVNEE